MLNEWISTEDSLPSEVQAYGRTSEDVYVRNSNGGFEGIAYLAYSLDGPKWFTADGKFELMSISHWRYIEDE